MTTSFIASHTVTRFNSGDVSVTLNGSGTNRCIIVLQVATTGGTAAMPDPASFGATVGTFVGGFFPVSGSDNTQFGVTVFNDADHPGAGAVDITLDFPGGAQNIACIIYELADASQNKASYTVEGVGVTTVHVSATTQTQEITGEVGNCGIGFWAFADGSFMNYTHAFSANMDVGESQADYNQSNVSAKIDLDIASTPLDFDFTITYVSGTEPNTSAYGVVIVPPYSVPAVHKLGGCFIEVTP